MKGIDIPIEACRLALEDNVWTDKEYNSYGRAFPNDTKDGIVPELLIDDTRQYLEILPDSSKAAQSFFYVEPNRTVNKYVQNAKVSIYFAVNLELLYPDVSERATEYAHLDVINEIHNSQFNITGVVTGIDAFDGFAFVSQNLDDMQPFYLFRIDTEINYSNNC